MFKKGQRMRSIKALLISASLLIPAYAGSLEQAQYIHNRLAGVPASAETLLQMQSLIEQDDVQGAAAIAVEHPDFYRVTLKLFASPWTNIDQDIYEPLNDYSATVIGMVRDDVDFRQVLQADLVYTADTTKVSVPAYQVNNNNHYQTLDEQAIDLKANLIARTQSELTDLPSEATAGILTSRAAAKAYFYLGTNRAMLRFTLMNHLCTDLEALKDNTRPADRIRQDVSRSPGGDSRLFLNNCLACHSGMDPLAQAFARYDYQFNSDTDPEGENGQIIYSDTVVGKYHINATTFPYGYRTENDNWDNFWRQGINQKLGWSPALSGAGQGAKSLGEELANSKAFATCQVKKVFNSVCLRPPASEADNSQVTSLTDSFINNGYKLKQTFVEVAEYCSKESE